MRGQELRVASFARGWFPISNADQFVTSSEVFTDRQIPDGGSPDCQNVIVSDDGRGSVVKRGGFVQFNGSALATTGGSAIQTVWTTNTADQPSPYFMVQMNTNKLYAINGGGTTTDVSHASANAATVWTGIRETGGNDRFYGGGFGVSIQKWTGSGAVTTWTPGSGSILGSPTATAAWKGCLYLYNNTSPIGRVQWSAPNDPETLPSTNFVDIESATGRTFALAPLPDYLLVFKRDRIYLIYDQPTGANRVLATGAGVYDPKDVCIGNDAAYFLDYANQLIPGIYRATAAGVEKISRQIDGYMHAFNTNNFQLAFHRERLYVCGWIAGSTTSGVVLVYDVPTDSWWRWTGPRLDGIAAMWSGNQVLAGISSRDTSGAAKLYQIDERDPFSPTYTDNGSGYASYWIDRPRDANTQRYKRLRSVVARGRGTVQLKLDRDATVSTLNASFDLATTQRYFMGGLAKEFRLQVNDNAGTSAWRLDDLTYLFTPRQT